MNSKLHKLQIGCANFGNPYGKSGELDQTNIEKIIDLALSRGVSNFDTAMDYGRSQEILFSAAKEDDRIQLTTKINFSKSIEELEAVEFKIYSSLACQLTKPVSVLCHNLEFDQNSISNIDVFLKRYSVNTDCFGQSIYLMEDLNDSISGNLVQYPVSFLEGAKHKNIQKLKAYGYKVSARSIFLRGMIFDDRTNSLLKSDTVDYIEKIKSFFETQEELQMFAVNWALTFSDLDQVVVGISSVSELSNVLDSVAINFDIDETLSHLIQSKQFQIDLRNP